MATTTAWLPYRSATVVMSAGSASAAVFRLTLSAPASTAAAASASVRMPPPTASGMKSSRATREIVSASARRASRVAVTSRITSSSMPSALYRRASSAGSPAERSPSKLTPLTTWPFLTSRHAMMRLESIEILSTHGTPRAPRIGFTLMSFVSFVFHGRGDAFPGAASQRVQGNCEGSEGPHPPISRGGTARRRRARAARLR